MATAFSAQASDLPCSDDEWRDLAKGILKAELKKKNLTYEDLAGKLADIGVAESEITIRNKMSRGAFSFVFALQSFAALGLDLVLSRRQFGPVEHLPPELADLVEKYRRG